MLRPVSLLPALVAVATLAAVTLAPTGSTDAAAAPQQREEVAPLSVTIDSLTPSTLPRRGPVRITGEVTNEDDETWAAVALYAFVSSTPMTTEAELAAATQVSPEEDVGGRIIVAGNFDTVGDLAPGESAQYSFRVARSQIPVSEPGVYWFGVHALGQVDGLRDLNADGRARTFVPLVPPTKRQVDTALVLPIRRLVTHAGDGSITRVPSWTRSLSPGGQLRAMVDFGAAAGSRPLTWLVDPAVPDTVRHLVAGNPPRSLEPTITDGDEEGEEGEEPAPPEPSDEPSTDGDTGSTEGSEPAAVAEAGSLWLDRLHEALLGNEILTLPYGDVDVAAAAVHDPDLYEQARERSDGALEPWGLPTSPAVASPTGYLNTDGIELTEPGTTLIVTDQMFGADPPAVARAGDHLLSVSSAAAASGGPGPDDPLAPIAVRQRIVSEAALRLLAPGREPLIVSLPTDWAPDQTAGFFEGLDVPWLHLTNLSSATQRIGRPVSLDDLDYPETQARLELGAASFVAARDLARAGDTLQNLLTENDQVGIDVRDEAFTDTSYSTRPRPAIAEASAERSQAWIQSRLRSVRIDAPKAVILSGGSGRFAATITNGLDQPVSVRIRALPESPLEVAVPTESVDIAAGNRATVLLNASSSALGIRNVTLALTDVQDVPLGSSDDLPIRSNQVSNVIWLILGTGVALLFGAIVIRLLRRFRAARSS